MDLSTLVFLSLVLCGMQDVHADDSLAKLTPCVRGVEHDLTAWKFQTETKLMNKFKVWEESLKEELTSTFLPSLIQHLVKQAITSYLIEYDTGHPISEHVLDEVHSLKDNEQNIKTQLQAITQDLRHVEQEIDTYRESVGRERNELTKDIRALQQQVNQTVVRATSDARLLRSELNQTIDDLLETNQTLAGITQDFRTLNTSCVVTEKEIQSYREDVQEMQRNVSTDIRSLNIQLNQTIIYLFDTNQTLTGLTQDLRALNTSCMVMEKEIKSYRDGLQEMWTNAYTDIRSLNMQLNQTISELFDTNQTLTVLTQDFGTLNSSCYGMGKEIKEPSTTTYPGTTEASTDPSPKSTVPPAPVTTQDLQASTTDASEDLTPSKTVPPTPVTTQGSDYNGTQLPTAGRDLFSASGYGDLERVKRILSAGHLNINYRGGEFSRTLVMEAARNGHRDVVEFLVGRGADVSLLDSVGDNALHFACYNGHLETVKLMMSLNVMDINSRGRYRRTSLMLAAWSGHRNVVEFLVSRGADMSLVDSIGNNFLHFACWGGHLETAKLILSLEVLDVNARNRDGDTAADYARRGQFLRHQRVLDFLMSRGAH
ncbi:uncharacterized protein [Haliotis asinina]|uniref:uncharacterized protein n=1 Tax=Haliotis asinina TaxID=109174 RepID=UPI0035326A85